MPRNFIVKSATKAIFQKPLLETHNHKQKPFPSIKRPLRILQKIFLQDFKPRNPLTTIPKRLNNQIRPFIFVLSRYFYLTLTTYHRRGEMRSEGLKSGKFGIFRHQTIAQARSFFYLKPISAQPRHFCGAAV